MMTVGDAWRKFSSNIVFYLVAGLLPIFLLGGFSMVGVAGVESHHTGTAGTSLIITVVGYVFTILGILAMIQKERDDEVVLGQTQLGMLDFTNVFTIAWKSVVLGIVVSVLSYLLGLISVVMLVPLVVFMPPLGILAIVPYMVISVVLTTLLTMVVSFVIYIKPDLSIFTILKDSMVIIKEDWVRLLQVSIVSILLMLAGLMAMGFGLVITLPIAVVYSVSHMVDIVDSYYNKDSASGKVEVVDDLMSGTTIDSYNKDESSIIKDDAFIVKDEDSQIMDDTFIVKDDESIIKDDAFIVKDEESTIKDDEIINSDEI